MKTIIIALLALLSFGTVQAQSMKMVVNSQGKLEGRYVRTNATTYTVCVQDDYDVPKTGYRIVVYSAQKGQGIVYRKHIRKGNINVRKEPSLKGAVIAKIPDTEDIPDTYPCLGKTNDWFKIRINGKVGYVREDMVEWDGMSTF